MQGGRRLPHGPPLKGQVVRVAELEAMVAERDAIIGSQTEQMEQQNFAFAATLKMLQEDAQA